MKIVLRPPLDEWKMGSPGSTRAAGSERVLIESEDGPEGTMLWRELTANGYEVYWCPGPDGPPAIWCPLMGGHACDLVDSADVVVSSLGLSSGVCREVLERLRSLHPEARVIVEATEDEAERWSSLLDAYQVLRRPVSAEVLFDAIELARSTTPDRR